MHASRIYWIRNPVLMASALAHIVLRVKYPGSSPRTSPRTLAADGRQAREGDRSRKKLLQELLLAISISAATRTRICHRNYEYNSGVGAVISENH